MYDMIPQQSVQAKPTANVVRYKNRRGALLTLVALLLSVAVLGVGALTYLRYCGLWDATGTIATLRNALASAWQWVQGLFA